MGNQLGVGVGVHVDAPLKVVVVAITCILPVQYILHKLTYVRQIVSLHIHYMRYTTYNSKECLKLSLGHWRVETSLTKNKTETATYYSTPTVSKHTVPLLHLMHSTYQKPATLLWLQ